MNAIKVAIGAAGLSAMVTVVATGPMGLASRKQWAQSLGSHPRERPGPRNSYVSFDRHQAHAAAADQGRGSQELHVVYASPGTITANREDGHFPDGTVLVVSAGLIFD